MDSWTFEGYNDAQIDLSGDVLAKKESAIAIVNHLSWTDFIYMNQMLAYNSEMLGRCGWFARRQLHRYPLVEDYGL